ncbi:hybrid sensor histidine kinase/response regulator [Pedobacter sp. ISL-68]|uniref:hybrid sensor histidine kinase/response regulator n=1 Tax=unclassified Pedobacter TaxID=2628915 RepID=UPI001BE5ECEE|nr:MULTISPECIES: hybrid sensor histidine kinase/response regulator [unclassified Pedobacter]MBT2563260.1 hybrid sensor histidine kinase/response regulator [Pedobacter sp. ISL-64]MBT2588699.1 hybrid sensor histidine kinase/response regulator [Pedobacter sp. ISL-68]
MILIVDDRPENLISLQKVLQAHSFEVDTASSGEEALKKVLKNNYVLIILDVQMPDMDGFEVAETISGFSKAKDTAIIFLSAVNTELKFITKGYLSGGLDYITKPVDINVLLLKIKTFYRIYEQNRKLNEVQEKLLEEIEFRKQAEHKKDEFISIASHELKTPLTSVKGYIQLLQRSLNRDDKTMAQNHLEKASTQLEKLNELIVDLLDISKIESGKMKFNMKSFYADNMVNNAIEMLQQSNPDFKISKLGKTDEMIFGDEMRLEQVVINFITNAIKYAPGTNQVNLTTNIKDEKLYLAVKDFGIGISKEQQDKIFDKFYRVEDNSNRFNGLGIGLYICSEIINRHGGTIGVKSVPDEGSEFYFIIPTTEEEILKNQI